MAGIRTRSDSTILSYNLTPFDKVLAASGNLCVRVPDDGTEYTSIKNVSGNDENSSFGGAGICSNESPNSFVFTYKGVDYIYNVEGKAVSKNAVNTMLMMGEEVKTLVAAGKAIHSFTKVGSTIDSEGNVTTGDIDYSVTSDVNNWTTVNSLNARDHFALEALNIIMSRVSNPSSLNDSQMGHYCKAAYRWAANMMAAAADSRATTTDNTPVQGMEMAAIKKSDLETPTEKLLNNIYVAVGRTDEKDTEAETIPAHWEKAGQDDVAGSYTDATAQSLPNSGTAYANVSAAEADGWLFVPESNVYLKRVTMPALVEIMENYVAHEPEEGESEEKTTVGLDDLIKAIKGLKDDSEGGEETAKTVNLGVSGLGGTTMDPLNVRIVTSQYSPLYIKIVTDSNEE